MYARFGITLAVSLLVMYLLTMSLVARWDHYKLLNLGNFYMALIMVSAMGVVMLALMITMYKDKRLNVVLFVVLAALFAGSLVLGRTMTFVGDEAFLRSMIPHHSRAILICENVSLTDPEIIELCEEIVETQREEIAQMQGILDRG